MPVVGIIHTPRMSSTLGLGLLDSPPPSHDHRDAWNSGVKVAMSTGGALLHHEIDDAVGLMMISRRLRTTDFWRVRGVVKRSKDLKQDTPLET